MPSARSSSPADADDYRTGGTDLQARAAVDAVSGAAGLAFAPGHPEAINRADLYALTAARAFVPVNQSHKHMSPHTNRLPGRMGRADTEPK